MFEDVKWQATRKMSPLSRNKNAIPIFNHVLDLSIRICENGEVADFNLVKELIDYSRYNITSLPGTLSSEVIMRVVKTVVDASVPGGRELGLLCVYYAAENRFSNAKNIADILLKYSSTFDETEKRQLNQLFAHETEWTNL